MVDPLVTANLLPTSYGSDQIPEWQSLVGSPVPVVLLGAPASPVVFMSDPAIDIASLGGITMSSSHSYNWSSGFKSDELSSEARMSPLGRQLLAIRRADIARGMVLLDDSEILHELAKRRGDLTWP